MENLAVLYICTGNYSIFWKKFYSSSEKYFLPEYKKKYFVFTDKKFNIKNSNIEYIYTKKIGWPYDTLYRFNFFSKITDKLICFDYIFFFNANALILKEINSEILPLDKDFVAPLHPCFIGKDIDQFPFERNILSKAFIDKYDGLYYFQACLFGGKSSNFIELINEIYQNIETDLSNNFIAIWHDESHLNKYLIDKKVKILDSSYIYPENFIDPYKNKIIMRDKNMLGGHELFRTSGRIHFNIKLFYNKIKKTLLKLR